jgi:hypothetical protein
MPLNEIKNGLSENESQPTTNQSSSQAKIDLQLLAVDIFEKLLRELEIENERLGQA